MLKQSFRWRLIFLVAAVISLELNIAFWSSYLGGAWHFYATVSGKYFDSLKLATPTKAAKNIQVSSTSTYLCLSM